MANGNISTNHDKHKRIFKFHDNCVLLAGLDRDKSYFWGHYLCFFTMPLILLDNIKLSSCY